MSIDLRLVYCPNWDELNRDENLNIREDSMMDVTVVEYDGTESYFYPMGISPFPEPVKAVAIASSLLEYLWTRYGTMWYTDNDETEFAGMYTAGLDNRRERAEVWEYIFLDSWKKSRPDKWNDRFEAVLDAYRPTYEKAVAIFDSMVNGN